MTRWGWIAAHAAVVAALGVAIYVQFFASDGWVGPMISLDGNSAQHRGGGAGRRGGSTGAGGQPSSNAPRTGATAGWQGWAPSGGSGWTEIGPTDDEYGDDAELLVLRLQQAPNSP